MTSTEIFEKINPLITIIGFVLGIFGVLFSIWSYRKSRTKKVLEILNYETLTLFEQIKDFKEIKIDYLNRPVENLYIFEIHIQNSGNIALQNDDFLKPFSITIEEQNARLLDYKIYTSNEFNSMVFSHNENSILINFNTFLQKSVNKLMVVYTSSKISIINVEIAILNGAIKKETIKPYNQYYFTKDRDIEFGQKGVYYFMIILHVLVVALFVFVYEKLVNYYSLPDYFSYLNELNKGILFLLITAIIMFNVFRLHISMYKHMTIKSWIKLR